MITTKTNHHEQAASLLPIIGPIVGSAVTIAVCYIKAKLEQNDNQENKDHATEKTQD